jgi:hypothetical protein
VFRNDVQPEPQPQSIAQAAFANTRSLAPVAAVTVLVVTAGLGAAWPEIGAPVAFAAAGYAVISLMSPGRIVRGRNLSPSQQHRAALAVAAMLLLVAGLASTAVHGLRLANTLEQRLRDEIDVVRTRGALRLGQNFEECAQLLCARARIVQLPSRRAVGIARLSGFARHDERVFGWRKSGQDSVVGVGTSRSAVPLSAGGGAP